MMPLDHEAPPPPALRTRVLRTLRARGLLRPASNRRGTAVRIAAGLLLFALGGLAGRVTAPRLGGPAPTPPPGDRYLLLLYADEGFRWDVPETRLVEEYRAWATSVRSTRFVRGERLGDMEQVLTAADTASPILSRVGVSGYFVIEAETWEQAAALARTCPHLRYGGRIVLRAVVPT
jgi:hypothetical protein